MAALFWLRFRSKPSASNLERAATECKKLGATRIKDLEWVLRANTDTAELQSNLFRFMTPDEFAVEPISRALYRTMLYVWRRRSREEKRSLPDHQKSN